MATRMWHGIRVGLLIEASNCIIAYSRKGLQSRDFGEYSCVEFTFFIDRKLSYFKIHSNDASVSVDVKLDYLLDQLFLLIRN